MRMIARPACIVTEAHVHMQNSTLDFEYFTFSLLIQPYVDGSRRNTNIMCYKTCNIMKARGVVFVLIRLKLVEKTYSGRIPTTRGRISVYSAITMKTDFFSWEIILDTLIYHILFTIGKAYKF